MDAKEVKLLGDDVVSHWYYVSKARALDRLLRGVRSEVVLDVGSGSCFFSKHLIAAGIANKAWCVDIEYASDFEELYRGGVLYGRSCVERSEADLVLMMDVLEHVDDDVGLLIEYMEKVPVGAKFLLSVPAFDFLWSNHDIFLDHRRRYSLNQVEGLCARAGLRVKKSCYFFGAVFPLAAVLRIGERIFFQNRVAPASQLVKHGVVVNSFLAALCGAELPVMSFNKLFGLTVFCLAEKM